MVICEVVVEVIPRGHGRKEIQFSAFSLGQLDARESSGCIFQGGT
jgi:hypothetical protein